MQLIASRRHTAIVIAILAFLAIGGYSANVNRKPKQPPNRPVLYVSVIIGQLLLTYYVKIGLRGVTIRDLIAPRWTPKQFALDILLAALLWAGWGYTSELIKRAIGVVDNRVAPLRPQNTLEVALWIAVSITAGICEEIVFRGYLQRQLGALAHSITAGIALQAIVFGFSHGYQGLKSMMMITIYGALFGILAWWRKSLVPGMLAHFWTDASSVVIGAL